MYGAYGYPQLSYYDYIRQSMGQTPQPTPRQSNVLPAQQVIQVAGRQSIDTLQMSPNSSVLIMDTSAPIVWLCVSDGLGKVTATAYDITLHQDAPAFDVAGFAGDVEERLKNVEEKIALFTEEMKKNAGEPHDTGTHSGKTNDWKTRRD